MNDLATKAVLVTMETRMNGGDNQNSDGCYGNESDGCCNNKFLLLRQWSSSLGDCCYGDGDGCLGNNRGCALTP
jgi:hypothetical protein